MPAFRHGYWSAARRMNAPARKAAPYVFYGQTTSLCGECLALVPAKIIIEGNSVSYLKRCKAHGVQKVLVSTDARYYRLCHDYLKPGDRPLAPQTRTELGCPYDCGLCPDHEQHSCLALIDVNEACNLTCPVCFADSSVKKTAHRPLAEIERMMDALVESEGEPDLLQISGGEPTIHPIERAGNERRIEAIVERLEKWHRDHIVGDRPPEAQTEEQRHALLAVLPVDVGTWTTPTDEDRALVADLARVRQTGRQAKEEERRILGRLIDRVGTTNGLEALLRGSHVKGRVTLDTKALAKAHPDIFAKFARTGSPSRRWTILDKTLNLTEEDTDNE